MIHAMPHTIALLNASEYPPNQVVHGGVGLVVFVVLYVFSRARSLWASYWIRVLAYVHLAFFLGMAVFKLSGTGFVEQWVLDTLPGSQRFYPFEPAAHMIEELATMGGFSYLAVVYLRREYPNVFERPLLSTVLLSAIPVYTVCWLVALCIGLMHPFPMTGLHTQLNDWSVLYRMVILLPGIFYCFVFTFVFWEAARQRTVARSARRQTLLAIGSLFWALACTVQLAWATLHALAAPSTRDFWASPYVVSESVLFVLMGLAWAAAALVSYRISPIERNIQDYMHYLRRMRHLKGELASLYRRLPQWKLMMDRLQGASRRFGLTGPEEQEALKLIQIASLPHLKTTYTPSMLASLDDLRSSLLQRLPQDSSEFAALDAEPEGNALRPALLLLDDPADVSAEPTKVQLAAGVLNAVYVLNRDKRYAIDPAVERALNLP
jgi:hypothetical protein